MGPGITLSVVAVATLVACASTGNETHVGSGPASGPRSDADSGVEVTDAPQIKRFGGSGGGPKNPCAACRLEFEKATSNTGKLFIDLYDDYGTLEYMSIQVSRQREDDSMEWKCLPEFGVMKNTTKFLARPAKNKKLVFDLPEGWTAGAVKAVVGFWSKSNCQTNDSGCKYTGVTPHDREVGRDYDGGTFAGEMKTIIMDNCTQSDAGLKCKKKQRVDVKPWSECP